MSTTGSRFSAVKDVPKYSRLVFETIRTPAVVYFVLIGNVVLFACIGLFHHFEAGLNTEVSSVLDSIWWGLSTITTVGYGDIVPFTVQGRIVGLVLMGTGVILFVGTSAIFMSAFFARVSQEIFESENLTRAEYGELMITLRGISARLDGLEKHAQASATVDGE